MRSCRPFALLACCLALLGAAAAAPAAGCAAEAKCVATGCGNAYSGAAADLPYSVDYTATADSVATTFHFKVCSLPCDTSEAVCQPLKAFRLRLSDDILASPAEFVKMANPEGTVQATCAAAGPGWFVSGAELLNLATHDPAQGEECEVFSLSIYNPPGATDALPLSDLCQQGVDIVDKAGAAVFEQSAEGPSCLYTLELVDGSTAVGALAQRTPYEPPTLPEEPTFDTEDNTTTEEPPTPEEPATPEEPEVPEEPEEPEVPEEPKAPVAKPVRPTGGYYGGYGSRRLQQAGVGFPRSLLASYYYQSASRRRLSSAVPEPLAFATRRLLDAGAVPLPLHLTARAGALAADRGMFGSRSLLTSYGYYASDSGRRLLSMDGASRHLATAYYYGSGSEHRRALLADRQLLSSYYYGHRRATLAFDGSSRHLAGTYYYGSEASHRRSLMSAGTRQLLTGYYYGTSHRRSLMSAGTDGRQLLTSYYYGAGHRRSLMSVGTPGSRQLLTSYYYGSEHRRSLLSASLDGRQLLSSYYYGGERRRSLLAADGFGSRQLLSGYYYGGERRRSLLAADGFGSRQLLSGYYYGGEHRRALLSSALGGERQLLSSYGGYYGGEHRRSLLSAPLDGRQLLSSYGGYYGARRLQSVAGSSGRGLLSYYYGSRR